MVAGAVFQWTTVLQYGGLLLVTWSIYVLFIKPILSPLRKIPGLPFYPLVGNMREAMKGEAMETAIRWTRKYGTVLRYHFYLGKPRLLVADPDALKHITVTNSRNYNKNYILLGQVLGKTSLLTLEGAEHRTMRKALDPHFGQTSLKGMVSIFQLYGEKLVDIWCDAVETTTTDSSLVQIPVQTDFSKVTLDVIGRCAFGYDIGSLQNKNQEVNTAFREILKGAALRWTMAVPIIRSIPTAVKKRVKHHMDVVHSTIRDIISQKAELLEKSAGASDVSSDLLGMLMQAKYSDTQEKLSYSELQDQVLTFMFAGHETSSVAMTWTLYTLASNQSVQQRVHEEAKQVLPPDGQELTMEHLDQLTYLTAVIKETMRLYPPATLTSRQALKDDVINGYFIPKGTSIVLALGAMMRHPDVWPEPDQFKPERFLGDMQYSPYHYMPFLLGPRMCIGHKFAMNEMKAILALILRKLHFDLVPGIKVKRLQRITMRPDPQLNLYASRI